MVTRRDSFKSCAVARGGGGRPPAAERPRPDAEEGRHPAGRLLHRGGDDGTRTSRAARSTGRSTTTSTSRWSRWDRGSGSSPGWRSRGRPARSRRSSSSSAAALKFHDGTTSTRRRKGQLRPDEDEPKSIRRARSQHRHGRVVDAATLKVISRGRREPARHAHRSRRHDDFSEGCPGGGVELGRNARGAGTALRVRGVGQGRPPADQAQRELLDKQASVSRALRYRPIPDDTVKRRVCRAARIDVIDYVQPRRRRAVKTAKNVTVVDVPSLADFSAYQLKTSGRPST